MAALGTDQQDAALANAVQAHPELRLDPAVFLAHLASQVAPGELGRVHAADLYLALACARGDTRALAKLDAQVMPKVAQVLARFEPALDVDDVLQKLRQRLLLCRGAQSARIANYSGIGSLAAWVRTVALRLAVRMTPRHVEEPAEEEQLARLVASDDPELDLLRGQYRAAFREAFRGAFETLSSKDRNVLRLHFIDGLTVDRIGALYGVHRGSAWRWLEQVRSRLERGTRARLLEHANLGRSELEHLLVVMQSQLADSIRRLLRPLAASGAKPVPQ